jgi:hypothetical protein
MNLNDLANLGQIIGAIAVVVSLIYVALQIRQNTNAIRSAAAQTVHEHFATWYRLVAADPGLSQIVVNGCEIIRSRKWREHGSSLPTWRLSLTRRMRFSSGAKDRSPRHYGWAGSLLS